MRGVNKVILVGNVGKDPEVRYLPSGSAVTKISMCTTESWKDKASGQMQEHTEWHRVVFYGKLAEVAGEYLKKGSKVYVEGSLHTHKWQDRQTGQDKYSTEIKASTMQMLDTRQGGSGGAPGGGFGGGNDFSSGGSFPAYEDFDQGAAQQQRAQRQQPGQQRPAAPADDFDDDIPF